MVTTIGETIRRLAWRLGRKLYCSARGDLVNDPRRNGEYWLLEQVIGASGDSAILFDVGANVGEWTRRATAVAASANRHLAVFAFEPSSATRAMLQQRFAHDTNVEFVPVAMSDAEGEADFFSNGAGSGTSSLNAVSGGEVERVRLATVDGFMGERGIERVRMLKIDTEGFDFKVLRGAERAMLDGRVDLIQFEYNWRWLLNRASLLQVFEFIRDKPYRFGKLVGRSVAYFDEWHFELDRFFENNYVLVREGSGLERFGHRAGFDSSNVAVYVESRH